MGESDKPVLLQPPPPVLGEGIVMPDRPDLVLPQAAQPPLGGVPVAADEGGARDPAYPGRPLLGAVPVAGDEDGVAAGHTAQAVLGASLPLATDEGEAPPPVYPAAPALGAGVPLAADDGEAHPPAFTGPPVLGASLPVAADEGEAVRPAVPPPPLGTTVALAGDLPEPPVPAFAPLPGLGDNLPIAADELEGTPKRKFFLFADGRWLPEGDLFTIGEKNYADLQNLRYARGLLEGVQGYTKINTSALSTYLKIRSGIQLRTPHGAASTVLCQAYNSGLTGAAVRDNYAAPPAQGNFSSSYLHTDVSSAGLGRFSLWPNNHVCYCNGKETMVWGGTFQNCDAFITSTAGVGDTLTAPIDATDAVSTDLESDGMVVELGTDAATTRNSWLVGSTRPMEAVWYGLDTGGGNAISAATISAFTWTGSTWSALSVTDGTSGLETSGTISWPSTVGTAKPKMIGRRFLYWYQFALSNGGATVARVVVKAPWQALGDIWDGQWRTVAMFRYYNGGHYYDKTATVAEAAPDGITSSTAETYCASVGGLSTSEYLDIGMDERTCAFDVHMCEAFSGSVNTNTSALTVQYWDGDAYVACTNLVDGTSNGGKSFGQSGVISWAPTTPGAEQKKEMYGVSLWWYRLTFSATPNSAWIDKMKGMPAPRLMKAAYRFPFMLGTRPMLCGCVTDDEGHRVDYGMTGAVDVWNGDDTSNAPGGGSLYFGAGGELTGAVEVFNRLSSSIYSFGVFTKATETYLLNGYDRETFKIYPISTTIGCPAPLTMDTCQTGKAVGEDGEISNIAMWLSYAGPVKFDQGGLFPVRGVGCYFDPNDSRCINWAAVENCRGAFSPNFPEYHLLIPSGSGQILCNVWLVYNWALERWFRIVPPTGYFPQCLIRVTAANGKQYLYGSLDTGYLMRLENGTTWDGTAVTQVITTGDQVPGGDPWKMTRLRRFMVIAEGSAEGPTLTARHYKDGGSGYVTLLTASLAGDPPRQLQNTVSINSRAWSHAFEFYGSTNATARGIGFIGWGYEYTEEYVKEEEAS